jgi:phage FluMu protein Com
VKKLKSLPRTTADSVQRGTLMITIACSACQKKLSVKEDHAGKKVKCPGCGQVTVVPAKVAAAVGRDERTLPSSIEESPGPDQIAAGELPTHPPLDQPDATHGVDGLEMGRDTSLTDFLAPPQTAEELGRLGGFRIIKILGHGGMGVVFLGEDPKLGRKVAIKVMLARFLVRSGVLAREANAFGSRLERQRNSYVREWSSAGSPRRGHGPEGIQPTILPGRDVQGANPSIPCVQGGPK